jgi:nucleoid DNA-binding protein
MNKSELIDAVAEAAGLSKADSTRAFDAVISVITGSLKSGDQVSVLRKIWGGRTLLLQQHWKAHPCP